ncbi:BN159_2729 family protein [Streptomyces sp. NPDC059466]|uniref:BN159_2729 family protein n=1 Tax=unclassified Streptomyces TaxID=2593676 RepID=UPI0036C90BF8
MTATPDNHTDIEEELTRRLGRLAHTFIAELDALGRLVHTGGAQDLGSPGQQHQAHPHFVPVATPQASPSLPAEAEQALTDLVTAQSRLPAPREAPADTADAQPADTAWIAHSPIAALRGTMVLPRADRRTPVTDVTSHPRDTPGSTPRPSPTEQPATATQDDTGDTTAHHEHAARWDVANRTATTADRLRTANAHRLELTHIASDDERVSVQIRAITLDDWEHWLTTIGAPLAAPTHRCGEAQIATGRIDEVDIHLTAHGVPPLLEQAVQAAVTPYCLGGRVYDLAFDHSDRHGQTWRYLGHCQEDEIPLLTLHGTDGPHYPMPSVITANGPLVPLA